MTRKTILSLLATVPALLSVGTGMALAHGGATDHIHPHGSDWVLFLAIVTTIGALLVLARR